MPQNKHDTGDLLLGFLGGGMMAEAIIRGILGKKVLKPDSIYVCELLEHRREALSTFGVKTTDTASSMLERCNVVILAVKPDVVPLVLGQISSIKPKSQDHTLYVSICAGVTLEALCPPLEEKKMWVRVMPNQPCVVGEAASAFAMNERCSAKHRQIVNQLLGACGAVVEVPEKNLDAVTGLSGSGPAFVFMMIEAMTDAGVRKGLLRTVASKLAAQTVLGAAKMALEFPERHPAELRNRVESPGGTTIAGTVALESGGFRAAVINAVSQATDRSEELGKHK
ncbi:Pyrroline-5-carboxylate reductase [Gracilariopsis chorda]|uniref:Pyrroline-5-carboxylate reductase n=1 Tax=Gracilariopsis chorda TaxID=448386 RepID=A0A2V3INE5_9FLOR|nr:Pyrroline-5-carboxylate reductase [Gracilariopsis chorda]|eukprot:PXF43569.1 Pyrroline-5-carboxylate reductase [Gracilariopsis chorda]